MSHLKYSFGHFKIKVKVKCDVGCVLDSCQTFDIYSTIFHIHSSNIKQTTDIIQKHYTLKTHTVPKKLR